MPRLNAFTNRILVGKGLRRRVSVIVTLASNTTNYTLGTAQIPGYVAGATDVTLVVNSGVYVYSTNTANAGLTVAALAAGDTVSIVNDGFILGMGGGQGATAGGNAVNINRSVLITNNSYIAGGGGAGGDNGGGGAGGGVGRSQSGTNGGAGGGPGLAGSNGSGTGTAIGGGGGGRILPGVGGVGVTSNNVGRGGGAGGGGGAYSVQINSSVWANAGGGGGGGWGASGGQSVGGTAGGPGANGGAGGSSNNNGTNGTASASIIIAGSAGGKAVNLNGNTVTWLANGTRWGAIS